MFRFDPSCQSERVTPQREITQSRVESVEVLRGLAALAVAWFHLTNGYENNWVRASGAYGWLGVEVFFVVSGFIIPYSIWRSYPRFTLRDFPGYLSKRLVRLEPPYLASILLVLVLWQASSLATNFAGSDPSWSFGQVAAHMAYAIPLTDYSWLQPVYWTLAYEFVFYITLGLLFGFMDQPGSKVWPAVVLVVLCLSLTDVLPSRCLLFVMGISVFRSMYLGEKPGWSLLLLTVASLAMALNGASMEAGIGAVAACMIWLSARAELAGRFWRPLSFLGAISYSLYLTHVPVGGRVVNLLDRYVPDGAAFDFAVSMFALSVSLLFAIVFWRFCERPAMNWSRAIRTPKAA
jgi:peptidoglycan/LPS O-acetylase OafA/YrhL